MRIVQPVTRTFRHQLRLTGLTMVNRNWILRRIAYLYDKWTCLTQCVGDTVEAVATVTPVKTVIRTPESLAKITYVWNEGIADITVYEDGVIVAQVAAGKRQRLPVNAKLRLEAITESGSTDVRVVTMRRCLCGDDAAPYESGTVTPTGVDLI